MTVHWAFKQLGIDPTTETSDIRRAYTKRLKAMDVDADVDGYARLRNARDVALAHAQGNYLEPAYEDYDEEELDGLADEAVAQPSVDEPLADVTSSKSPQPTDEYAAAQRRLIQLLFTGEEQLYFFTAEEAREALDCFEFLKTDPRLDQIDVASSASDWFAQILAQSSPRSDPLVRPVASYFGWKRDQEVGVSPAVAAVIARANALDWRDRLQQRSHRLHRAWKELTKPAAENSKRGWVSSKRIGELLREIRTRHPSLEHDLDWYRVSLWESGGPSPEANWRIAIFVVIFLIQIARFASPNSSNGTDNSSSPEPQTLVAAPLSDPDSDISTALDNVTGGSLDSVSLHLGNGKLYDILRADWDRLKDDKVTGRETFMRSETFLLVNLVNRGWAKAPYSVLREKMEADVRIAQALPAAGCADFLAGAGEAAGISEDQINLRRRVAGKLLLAIDPDKLGPEPKSNLRYRIPGPVIEDAAKRMGIPPDQFGNALNNSDNKERLCKVRLAVRQAILAQPERAGLAIMRDMED